MLWGSRWASARMYLKSAIVLGTLQAEGGQEDGGAVSGREWARVGGQASGRGENGC